MHRLDLSTYAPVRFYSPASQYQFALAVLEWSEGFVINLPPVAKLEPFIPHRPHLSEYEQPLEGYPPNIEQIRHPLPAYPGH